MSRSAPPRAASLVTLRADAIKGAEGQSPWLSVGCQLAVSQLSVRPALPTVLWREATSTLQAGIRHEISQYQLCRPVNGRIPIHSVSTWTPKIPFQPDMIDHAARVYSASPTTIFFRYSDNSHPVATCSGGMGRGQACGIGRRESQPAHSVGTSPACDLLPAPHPNPTATDLHRGQCRISAHVQLQLHAQHGHQRDPAHFLGLLLEL